MRTLADRARHQWHRSNSRYRYSSARFVCTVVMSSVDMYVTACRPVALLTVPSTFTIRCTNAWRMHMHACSGDDSCGNGGVLESVDQSTLMLLFISLQSSEIH